MRTLGVDEHIWRPSWHGPNRVTGMVDLTRDQHGACTPGCSTWCRVGLGPAYAGWLRDQPAGFIAGVEQAALDPFRGYANAIRDELPDAVACWTRSTSSGSARTWSTRSAAASNREQLGHRGHRDDPLYRIRGLLRHGAEHLTARQVARLDTGLAAGDPSWELTIAWHCYQRLRSIYHARSPAAGRRIAEHVIASFPTCPIAEVARLVRTLRAWRAQVLAYFDTGGVSNGGTEAINLITEKTRRLAHGFRTFAHHRLRILLAADGQRTHRRAPAHA